MIPDDESLSMHNSTSFQGVNEDGVGGALSQISDNLTLDATSRSNNNMTENGKELTDGVQSHGLYETDDCISYETDSEDGSNCVSPAFSDYSNIYREISDTGKGMRNNVYQDGVGCLSTERDTGGIQLDLSSTISRNIDRGECNSSSISLSTAEFPIDRFRRLPSRGYIDLADDAHTPVEPPGVSQRDASPDEWNDCTWWVSFRDDGVMNSGGASACKKTKEDFTPPTKPTNQPESRRPTEATVRESNCGKTKHSHANLSEVKGRGCSEQSQFAVDSARVLRPEPERERTPVTGEKPTRSMAFMPIRVTITVGNVVTDFDLSDVVEMAGRPIREKSPGREARRDGMRSTCECRECRRRLDEQDRRIDELENLITRCTHEMKVSTDDLNHDMREVQRRIDVHDNRPILVTPRPPELCEAGRHSLGIFAEPAQADKLAGKMKKSKVNERQSRPRAASFAGTQAIGPERVGDEWRTSSRDLRRVARNTADPPKPQRAELRRGRSSRNKDPIVSEVSKPKENTMRDWLSTAKRSQPLSCDTPKRDRRAAEIETSPSWADEPAPDDDEFDTSESLTPHPNGNRRRDDVRTPESRQSTGASDDEQQVLDVYKLPPSGQVTERQRAQNGNERNAGNNMRGGARPKTRGKQQESQNRNDQKDRGSKKPNNKNGNISYSKVVTNSGWKTVQSKKRRVDKASPKQANPLKGIAMTRNRDIYLQGLKLDDDNDEDDVIDSVKAYCKDRDIVPVYTRLIPVRFDSTRTGCRLTVREVDYNRAVQNDFWPDHIKAREWTQRPRDGNGNDGAEARPLSDYED